MSYLFETHMHTAECSRCAQTQAKDQIKTAFMKGYSGVVITDHFYPSSSYMPDRNLPWKEQIKQFSLGWEAAREEGEKLGLKVFFGLEMAFPSYDMLTYGVIPDQLEKMPELQEFSFEKLAAEKNRRQVNYDIVIGEAVDRYSKIMHDAGGYLAVAHPCRERKIEIDDYILRNVDGIETFNGSVTCHHYPKHVTAIADRENKNKQSGSDAHHFSMISGGVYFERMPRDYKDFIYLLGQNPVLKRGDEDHVEILD